WQDILVAILYATHLGVIVVEAAANGDENLDDDLYEIRPPTFPSQWGNPFRRSNIDSGAILVGAGAPPIATHGPHGPDRSRMVGSNYGAIVDAQGWGHEVTTTGYGFLQGNNNTEDRWYTDQFAGTSAAAAMIAGVLACVQGVLRANK